MRIGYLRVLQRLFFHGRCSNKYLYSGCVVVVLVIQQAIRMRRIMFSSVTYLAAYYFSTLSHTKHDFRNKLLTCNVCFDFLYNICLKYFMCQFFLSDVNKT